MRLPFTSRRRLWDSNELIREELFAPDRLKQHAETLAAAQHVSSRKKGGRQLASRLAENEKVLLNSYSAIAASVETGRPITPAAEWILDNYHIVEEQIREVRADLPPGFYKQLPKLIEGPFIGLPRVFGVGWAYVAHTDSRFDADLLCGFVDAYQRIQALTIGELWAVPITLRIILLENLRRAAGRIVRSHKVRLEADEFADRILGLGTAPPEPIARVLANYPTPYLRTFIVQLAHRLRDPTPGVAPAVQWLEQQVARTEGATIEVAVHAEHRRQAEMNVTVRNIITSMREISAIEWPEIFERVSLVDDALRTASGFAEMDFPTRDAYRKRIEQLSRRSKATELDVATRAIDLAWDATDRREAPRKCDPGYYLLVPEGRATLARQIGYRPTLRDRGRRLSRVLGVRGYVGVCIAAGALVLGAVVWALSTQIHGLGLVVFAFLGVLPAVDLAATVISRLIQAMARPVALPAMDLQEAVPPDLRTMVVIPTLLSDPTAIVAVTGQLELHHLSNEADDLTFALLSDWTDAPTESAATDGSLLRLAADEITRLNRRYPRPDGDRFLLLHRRRLWSQTQECWIGWERKRGKLHELNRLLRGATDTTFIAVDGQPPRVPADVRYVVTLDSDTRLPRDTIARLVGKMAHVLNRPRIDPQRRLVVEGYGILQPRVTLALPYGSEGSWFQRVFSGATGMDPYAAPISDVYQDLFGDGSFLGKGIYDVDAFEATMEGRTPENAILSHDLFEGIFARAGLAGDVEVVEEFPHRYDVAASRQHRWARGDWQLLRWLVEWPWRRPGEVATATLLGRWKMLDNLRRTLSAPVTVIALIAGWTLPPTACLIWSAFVLIALAAPAMLPALLGVFSVSPRSTWRLHFATSLSHLYLAIGQTGFVVATLVHQAQLMIDAQLRTLWRLVVTRKRLLEWTTAEQAGRRSELTTFGFYRWMATSVVVAAGGGVVAFANTPATGLVALPFILVWAAAPAIAYRASRVRLNRALAALTVEDARQLRKIARHTWRFFEVFVTAEDNWLPPDNFQEALPEAVVARRTSPTNIGLYLLATISAYDFGWVGLSDTTDRLEATFGTLRKMFRFRGHFYNWYDTKDLRALDPEYVSSVDSGNFAGHLIAFANACEEMGRAPPMASRAFAGVNDAVRLARDAFVESGSTSPAFEKALTDLEGALLRCQQTDGDISRDAGFEGLAPFARVLVEAAMGQPLTGDDENTVTIWAKAALQTIESHHRDSMAAIPSVAGRLAELAHTARETALQMDFRFLMDPERKLMSIGYVTMESRRDSNCYDLLASEARLASLFAIAKGDVLTKHWFRLGRRTTIVDGAAALVSWSGSMFEYLMPSLVMRAPAGSLLESTSRLIVQRQIEYGAKLSVPWGISESAFNGRNFEFTYQYSNFGVPGLGLKRGLSANTVIAPYATALAAMVDPVAAVRNFEVIAKEGGRGRYGFYEALDYTPSRVPSGDRLAVVHAYMAHHQGMSIVALANVLLAGRMRQRFHSEPMIAASALLLEERNPEATTNAALRADEARASADVRPAISSAPRQFDAAQTVLPQAGLLSNTRYSVMMTVAGSGYSRWNNLAVTRWREDATLDDWGSYIYLRDTHDKRVWSAGYQPTAAAPDNYTVVFAEDRIRIVRSDRTIRTSLEIALSTEEDAEVRRVSLTNVGGMERQIEVTSYAEVVLGSALDDVAHPAFSKMFVQTEFWPDRGLLVAHRRKRAPDDADVWAAHFAVVDGEAVGAIEVETDRSKFIGTGHDLRSPVALDGRALSNTTGTVLDAIFSIRRRLLIKPGMTVRISYWTVVGETREAVLESAAKYDDTAAFDRAATLAWTHAQVQLRHIDLTSAEASLFQRLAGCILFPEPQLRAADKVLESAAFDLRALWVHGISGDLPIVLLRIDSDADLDLVRELVLAHDYLHLKRLAFDLVILNERGSSYAQDLQQALEAMARISDSRLQPLTDEGKTGKVFVLPKDRVSDAGRLAIAFAARALFVGSRGSLAAQLERARGADIAPPPKRASRPVATQPPEPMILEFANGLGGFGDDGREYVTTISGSIRPPAPWINVVANPSFGFHIAADGASYTWSINSRDNQITPWSNDAVINRSGEAIYIRDDDTRDVWGPTAHPFQNPNGTYRARHGRGYSRFEHTAAEIASDLTAFVPIDDPVKIMRLRLTNLSGRVRHLSVAAYIEWTLGQSRSQSAYTVTEMSQTGGLLARNARNSAYAGRIAFLALGSNEASWTGDRAEFLGRHGSTAEPAALTREGALSGRVGGGLDPCGAFVSPLSLAPAETTEVVILLGQATSRDEAESMVIKYRSADLDQLFASVGRFWDEMLGSVVVSTPDRSMDVMLNGWALYQTLACRMWARSGFYQASGAYGFRDQLQDCLALCSAAPTLARDHILRAAARQFVDGDVQHWWLPTTGQGVRTRIADDPVWLAYAVAEYVRMTGDLRVLDEPVPYLQGPHLAERQHDIFFEPGASEKSASLYQHCVDALERSLKTGDHGLPLMGAGDWNDGMNRVGIGGRGESVWLAWFIHKALTNFTVLGEARGDNARAAGWRAFTVGLAEAAERAAWDGAWYRRAFFDDGTPLGSSENEECRIDSIAQSWAVISGAALRQRAETGMAEAERQLLRWDDKLALLFTPPFDRAPLEPGYIKGYPPGLRENGGQYTHAAIWLVIAEAMLGEGEKAATLFAMLNPINHTATAEAVARYQVEPYAVAADVYSAEGHIGRGGWTWYTGSAGWLYRAGIEWILGLRREGSTLRISPSIPASWPGFRANLRHGSAQYDIVVENPQRTAGPISGLSLDGRPLQISPAVISLHDDGLVHEVRVVLGGLQGVRASRSNNPG